MLFSIRNGSLLAILLVVVSSVQAKTCCDTQSGQFLDLSNDECLASGYVPFDPTDPMSAAATMVCFQGVNDAAQEALRDLGLPNRDSVDLNNLPTSAEDLATNIPEDRYGCCNTQSGLFEGDLAPQACRALSPNHYPDLPEFVHETESCRGGQQAGSGAWHVSEYEPNIENGGMEDWQDDHRPRGFASFGIAPGLTQGLPQAPAMDIQVTFRDNDAHTGEYSLRLKNFDVTDALPARVREIAIGAVGNVVSPAGAHTCRAPCTVESGNAAGSNSLTGAFKEIASLAARDVRSHVCGAYKGYIATTDQLRIDLVLESSQQVNGGAQAIFTRSTGDWIEFVMPMSGVVGELPKSGAVAITARIEPRAAGSSPYAQAMASLKQTRMSPLTEVNVDSIHFCDPMGINAFHPMIVTGGDPNVLIPEDEEDTLGVQTFVNRDNDDADGNFDNNDTEVSGDDELVRLQMYLPINSFGQVRFSAPELGRERYALWNDADKSEPFVHANQTLEVLDLLRTTADGSRYERNVWIEALGPSESVGDLRFEFTFESEFEDRQTADVAVITALDFSSIRFEGQDNSLLDSKELDPDPNFPTIGQAKNVRVFPGKRWDSESNAPENQARNRVDVVATLNLRPVRPIQAFFKSFDVDDPSATDDEVDDESSPEDNRGTSEIRAGYFPRGENGTRQTVQFEDQEAKFEFQVTMRPGDNFRLVGSFDEDHLDALENDDATLAEIAPVHAIKIVDKDVWANSEYVGEAALPQHTLSEVLTVWRKLYLEIDTMRAVRDNKLEGFITSVAEIRSDRSKWRQFEVGIDKNIYESLPDDSKSGLDGIENAYRRGTITINNKKFHVDYSTANRFFDDTITLTFAETRGPDLATLVGADPVGLPFSLVDHDEHKNGDELKAIPLDRMLAAYQPAYVRPVLEPLPHNPISRVPFLLNYQDDQEEYLRSIYEFDNLAHHEDPDFWLVYLLTAYQGMTKEDGDGGYLPIIGKFKWENAISGQADNLPGGFNGQGAAVFVESGQELEDGHKRAKGWRLSDTAPHEIGHLFGGDHRDGGLMDDRKEFKSENFSAKSLAKIRGHLYP